MIKVDIISGFLGAGKTTFIKELVSKAFKDEKIVLIENEFGEIGIDSRFMQNCGIEVTEMNSGCICCTLVGDFARALKQVADKFHPDRIIIEPSGVGKLSDVARAVEDMKHEAELKVDSRIAVVDGKKAHMYMKNFGEFYNDQIENASVIVISRTQMMDEKSLRQCVELLREKNERAAIITTPWQQLSAEMLTKAFKGSEDLERTLLHEYSHEHSQHECCNCHDHHEHHHDHHHDHSHNHGHHHADEIFSSWGIQTVHKFSRAQLEDTLKLLSMTDDFGTVLRAKGIVECDDGQWLEFDMVPEEAEIRECAADYTGRVCVIGTELNTEDLGKIFGK